MLRGPNRRRQDWLAAAAACFVAIQAIAAFLHSLSHPEMTQMQVLLAARDWLVPLRWL